VLRWRIAILVSAAIAISYLDRQTLSVAIDAIRRDIPVSNQSFANLNTAFLFAYAMMYLGGGKMMDILGTRRGFALTMVVWSLACASHALAVSFAMLAVSRFLLGMGEGGGFPAATRAMAEWFSAKDRSLAMGIMNGGTAVGMIVAPPLIRLVLGAANNNWRWIFILTGGLGLLWTLFWWNTYYAPNPHPSPLPEYRARGSERSPSWVQLLGYKQTWGLLLAKFLTDAAWYFYLFWLPKYLYDARGFDIKQVGAFAWIPPAGAGVGCLLGGWLSGWLVRKHFSLNVARKTALGLSAALMPFVLFITHVHIAGAIALFTLAYFGQQSWSTLVMVLPADLFPESVVGAVAGMVGFGGAMGGIVFGEVVGRMLDHGYTYAPIFALAGTFHVLAFLLILATVPHIRRLTHIAEPVLEGV
jgi:ACS family hexuronate transporter-like MFS transporter